MCFVNGPILYPDLLSFSTRKCFILNAPGGNEHTLVFSLEQKSLSQCFDKETHLSVIDTIEHYDDYLYLQEKIKTVMQHCFNCVKNKLEAKVGYFELYGYDFMIDTDFNVSSSIYKHMSFCIQM